LTGYTRKANYLSVDGTSVHVTGSYSNGLPKIQVKLDGLGRDIILSPTHRGRDGKDFTSTVYRRLVGLLVEADIHWPGDAHAYAGFWPGE
jgi:hypothetical protein